VVSKICMPKWWTGQPSLHMRHPPQKGRAWATTQSSRRGLTTTGEGSSASERPQSIAPAGIDPPAVVAHTATHVRWGWWVFRQWRVEPRWSNVRGDGVGDVGAFAHGNATSRACADIGLGTVRTPDGDRSGCKSSERPRDHKAGFIGDGVEHRGHLVGDSRGGRPCGSGLRLGKR
jgi:hypothetical protein